MKSQENQSHYTQKDNFYEWWYFDFISKDGDCFNIIIHETDIFGKYHKPYYSLSYLSPGRKYLHLRSEKDLLIKSRGAYLRTRSGEIIEGRRRIYIELVFDKGVIVKLEIVKKDCITPVSEGLLYRDLRGSGIWFPVVIGGKFSGTLRIFDKEKQLKGLAYHDHQWGSLPVQKYVSDWLWGHFHSKGRSLVFFKIIPVTGSVIDRYYYMGRDSSDSGDSGVDLDIFDLLRKTKDPKNGVFEIAVCVKKHTVQTSIDSRNLMRVHSDQKIDGKKYSYFRWKCEGKLDSLDSVGVIEYMRFR